MPSSVRRVPQDENHRLLHSTETWDQQQIHEQQQSSRKQKVSMHELSPSTRYQKRFLPLIFGGAEGNRTHDLLDAIEMLSQLSYRPMCQEGADKTRNR